MRPADESGTLRGRVLPRRFTRLTSALAVVASNRRVVRDVTTTLARGAFGDTGHIVRTVSLRPDLRAEKIVSHKHRYLWLCNPKVASRSIKTTLLAADPAAEIHHASIFEVYKKHPEVRSYYTFGFVRNPFTRALSFHAELHVSHRRCAGEERSVKKAKHRVFIKKFYGLAETGDFGAYCRWLNTPYGSDAFADRHFLSQHVQIRLEDGRLPDFIGRLENIDEDWKRIALRVGMPATRLPMLNTMTGWSSSSDAVKSARAVMSAHLTDRNRGLLATRYADDLSLYMNLREDPRRSNLSCELRKGWQGSV